MNKKEKVDEILNLLDKYYPTDTVCYLDHENDWQLLFATILSAQCTDDRVNIITKDLFAKYDSLQSFAEANIQDVENIIKPVGFYKNKAKYIVESAMMILINYNGVVPKDIEELVKLPGVGRKTANVIRSHIYNLPSVVVDTHVKRISNKWGITSYTDPVKIEFDLMKILPEEHWIRYNTQVIAHGRKICKAQRPKCEICPFTEVCDYYIKNSLS